MSPLKICLIIPTYNNQKTVKKVIQGCQEVIKDILVINDGSTDETKAIIEEITGIKIFEHPKNLGKGRALQTGFKEALKLGFDYAITIDSDGQHETANLKDMVEVVKNSTEPTLWMGSRNMDQAGIPKKSSFGNRFSNFWYWIETGIRLSDTQTGFRAYPLNALAGTTWYTPRFEFEIEIIVRAAWKGIPVREVPVKVYYPEDRVSHFRPGMDFFRISILNTFLVVFALFWHTPKRVFFRKGKDSFWNRFKREVNKDLSHPIRFPLAMGMGVFFGIFPIWGFQMLVAFSVASFFKLNKTVVLLFSNISIPPFLPIIIGGSFWVGQFFVSEPIPLLDFNAYTKENINDQIIQYFIGAVVFSVLAGVLTTLIGMIFYKIKKGA